MANEEQLAIMEQGVRVWNEWGWVMLNPKILPVQKFSLKWMIGPSK